MDHITIEEMVEFIQADKLTPRVLELGSRVNSHIFKCKKCEEIYYKLLDAEEAIKAAVADAIEKETVEAEEEDEALIKVGLKDFESFLQSTKEKVNETKELLFEIAFETFSNLKVNDNVLFSHPAPVGCAKSVGGKNDEELKSMVISNDENQNTVVSIGEDGSLTLKFFDKEIEEATLCARDGKELRKGVVKKSLDGSSTVTFYDCTAEEYSLKLKIKE